MAAKLNEGDAVQVVDREATPEEEKNHTFFNYYRNLSGTLERVYPDGMATVVVDPESLPEDVRTRHFDLTEKAKNKWLDGLSGEARAKLTPDEKVFNMRYTILVDKEDLVAPGTAPKKKKTAKAAAAADEPKAVTSADLERAEEQALAERLKKKG